ncbi:LysM peptidoglycan-binding domain-containing protein [Caloramator sp. Dgby_cultured_2]|uniref:LysM peptidoglycan-binding domain-containing protein n=1 Tax=Caloramator sp. Dgby_cultured_2 TaxID=3029174 RepID=UPI00237E0CC6|nr:LysM peptidoglycan-binding domain-containing protein [Caloramator sp. Dgby_cultured_2]WDU82304.1 LysM peptidoglycan-binding domain-containing protein [Caloramator sp. Dgby_cultured_2]
MVATSTVIIISTLFMNYTSKNKEIQRYEIHVVQPGDTLWKISKMYRPNEDPRKVVWEIQKHNKISPVIRPGQVLEIPIR